MVRLDGAVVVARRVVWRRKEAEAWANMVHVWWLWEEEKMRREGGDGGNTASGESATISHSPVHPKVVLFHA